METDVDVADAEVADVAAADAEVRDEPATGTDAASYAREAMGHRPVLFSAAYRMTRNPADAEDLVQETFLRAHKNCSSFQGAHLRAWLSRILTNTFINAYHARRLRPEVVGLDGYDRAADPVGIGRDPAEAVLDHLPDEVLRAALSSLSPLHLRTVLLADVEGYAYKEIARITGVPVGTVMSRLSRGRRALREYLEAQVTGAAAGSPGPDGIPAAVSLSTGHEPHQEIPAGPRQRPGKRRGQAHGRNRQDP